MESIDFGTLFQGFGTMIASIIGKSNRAFFQNDWYKKTLSICQK